MANPNTPFGFRPVTRLGGIPYSLATYGKIATEATAIFQGDLLGKVADKVSLPESATSQYVPAVASAYDTGLFTAGTSLWVGVAANYGAASTATVHQVVDEPDAVFIIQGKTGTTYSTSSHVGKRANISLTTAGSTTTKQSGITVDGATIAATATLDLALRQIAMISPNAEGANAIFEVTINKHIFGQQTAGV